MNRYDIVDTLIQRPVSFTFKRRRYEIYPLTLGKIQLCSRLIEELGFEGVKTNEDLFETALTAVRENKKGCLRLVAYVTLPGDECLNETKVLSRIKEFRRVRAIDLSSILVLFLSSDKTDEIMREYKIDKESKRLSDVLKVKNDSKDNGSLSFGGKSIWGTLIDAACERYGWSYEYILWGISFPVLQLLLADYIKTVYLSEDERKRIPGKDSERTINAEDKASLKDYILQQNWS